MKEYLITAVVGLAVGLFYAAIRVKAPVPPFVLMIGLVGMLVGEWAWVTYAPRLGLMSEQAAREKPVGEP